MKLLYAIQGTGNGHLSRARDIVPLLMNYGEVDILISGTQADIELPYPVKFKMKGFGFIFGKKGGVDLWQSVLKNNLKSFIKEVKQIPVDHYDLVINDFEPVTAWACFFKRKPCVALSHQSAVLSAHAPRPLHKDGVGRFILKFYAPTKAQYGFHFERYNDRTFTPVIRKQVRELFISNTGHYTVYLPAYSDKKIINILSHFKEENWEVFSKHSSKAYQSENVSIRPINNDAFLKSVASSAGVLCGAGFETPAEALFLKKKLMVIPMENQYEQHCNAAALQRLGVPVLKKLKKKKYREIENWINNDQEIHVDYPDGTHEIIENLITNHQLSKLSLENESFLKRLNSSIH